MTTQHIALNALANDLLNNDKAAEKAAKKAAREADKAAEKAAKQAAADKAAADKVAEGKVAAEKAAKAAAEKAAEVAAKAAEVAAAEKAVADKAAEVAAEKAATFTATLIAAKAMPIVERQQYAFDQFKAAQKAADAAKEGVKVAGSSSWSVAVTTALCGISFNQLEAAHPDIKKLSVYRTNKSAIIKAQVASISLLDDDGLPRGRTHIEELCKAKENGVDADGLGVNELIKANKAAKAAKAEGSIADDETERETITPSEAFEQLITLYSTPANRKLLPASTLRKLAALSSVVAQEIADETKRIQAELKGVIVERIALTA